MDVVLWERVRKRCLVVDLEGAFQPLGVVAEVLVPLLAALPSCLAPGAAPVVGVGVVRLAGTCGKDVPRCSALACFGWAEGLVAGFAHAWGYDADVDLPVVVVDVVGKVLIGDVAFVRLQRVGIGILGMDNDAGNDGRGICQPREGDFGLVEL